MKEIADQGGFLLLVISVYKTNQTIWNLQMCTIVQVSDLSLNLWSD